ncbi:heavy metal translocating P-type ATPase [Geosporobacter ferrireducens]|uniref:heavy metal translocating P-type ATPase n=1 Tax=Geosporobacter ferrireducens TaxID=1424294 RepID=UPI00139BCF67|nr:heavy metal translocating P-type ATPase [Geosporobacter ferrireducens]MTI56408.1 cadmium-translocating P-type ATPase [Geosporobacter ferrireducens]
MLSSVKKEVLLEGLDCASCAMKIEERINNIEGVLSASLNFITNTLTFETDNNEEMDRICDEIDSIVHSLEPHVIIKAIGNENVVDDPVMEEDHNWKEHVPLGIGILLFLVGIIGKFSFYFEVIIYISSYLLIGGEVLWRAVRNIGKGQVFDENFLMSVATLGAFVIGEYTEAVAVMLFYQVGELFQDYAVNRSKKSIKALLDIRPDSANVKIGEEIQKVKPQSVKIGEIIVVRPGEKIPLDGKIIEGISMVDTSALTGESVPRNLKPGDQALSGMININGLLTMVVEKTFGESTVSKILELVQNATAKKAPTENFITKFAKYYTPIVVFTALGIAILPPLLFSEALFADWIYRALIFLVVSCPCALVVSIPLGFFGGIGGASRNGILVKGGNYLEALNDVDTIVFDKTGTLTKGIFKVKQIRSTGLLDQEKLLEYAACGESYANHPIGKSILQAYGKEIERVKIQHFEEIPGFGTRTVLEDKEILVGSGKLMEREGIVFERIEAAGTAVYIAFQKVYAGYILIDDEIKEDASLLIQGLKQLGIKRLVMLTGDHKTVAESVGSSLGITEIYAELLPHEKVAALEGLEREKQGKGKILFLGDGINDAPVLARADIGAAMGGLGSDAAIEASDIVIMDDAPSKLIQAIKIAKKTRKIVYQNIIFALGVKGIVLILGAGGLATMWEAVFADVGVALLAILNALRIMKIEETA